MPFHEPLTGPLNGALLLSISAAVIYGLIVKWPASWRRTAVKALSVALLAWLSYSAGGPVFLTVALLFSAIGDAFLANDGERNFLAGLIAFFTAHVFYVVLFATYPGALDFREAGAVLIMIIAVLVSVALVYGAFLWKRSGALQVPVMAYIAVILAMVTLGLLVPVPLVGVGVVLFMASDMILAFEQFIADKENPQTQWISYPIWILYYSGQVLIMLGLILAR